MCRESNQCNAAVAGQRDTDAGRLQQSGGDLWARTKPSIADLAPLGKLDGVINQIDEYLAEAQRIADQVTRHAGRQLFEIFQNLFVRLAAGDDGHAVEHLIEVEFHAVDIEPAGPR